MTSELIMSGGSAPATPGAGTAKIFINSSKNLAIIDDTGRILDLVNGPVVYSAAPANPTGTTNTTGLMMGLAGTITPALTGRILVTVTGTIFNTGTTIGNGGKTQLRFGTGSAPANAAALTGTAVGSVLTSVNESTTASTKQPFCCTALISALTLGTAYWLDLSLAQVGGGGTATIADLNFAVAEV